MNDRQFDRAARHLATSTDRRTLVQGIVGTGLGALLLRFGPGPESAAASTTAGIAEAINNYRVSRGLPAIPVSVELTAVAKTHVDDLLTYGAHMSCGFASLHSWSENGPWIGGCYDSEDPDTYPIMWDKPEEITGYLGTGYEISAMGYENADSAVEGWKESPGHNDVILNQGVWANYPWGALGGWIEDGIACAWFGQEPGTPPGGQSIPPGSVNPTFAGVKLTITNAASTPSAVSAKVVYDGNSYSNWHSGHSYPTKASLRLDLGSDKPIYGVKWKFSSLGFADIFHVRMFWADGTISNTYGPFGNGTATQTWFGTPTDDWTTARFVQFLFANPLNDSAVGAISEVEIWGRTPGNPGMVNPNFSGSMATVTNALDSLNTGTAKKVLDGQWSTYFVTPASTPSNVTLTLDLGGITALTGVKWGWGWTYDCLFEIRISNTYGGSYTSLGIFGFGSDGNAYTLYGVGTSATGRFVQFVFSNPYRIEQIGGLAEVEIWRQTPVINPPGTANITLTGSKATITNAFDSLNTGTATRVRDGQSWSNFATLANRPAGVTLTLDLGSAISLSGIRWMWSALGYADQYEIRISTTYGGSSTSLGTFGNGTSTGTWFGVATSATARFVQFVFANPNNDVALGALAEVEIWRQGVTTNPPGTINPSVSGLTKRTPTNIFAEPASSSAWSVADGATWSNWASPATTPSSATLTFDLGSTQTMRVIRWQMPNLGYADQFQVRVATSYGSWTTLGTFGNPGSSYTWYGLSQPGATSLRFVQLVFANPNGDAALGAIGEIEVWGPPMAAMALDNPTFEGEALPIVESDANAGDTGYVDGDSMTITFIAASDDVEQTTATFELEAPVGVTGVRWITTGGDLVTLETSLKGEDWQTLDPVLTIANDDQWQGVPLPEGTSGGRVRVTIASIDGTEPAPLTQLEVWGITEEASTPIASPQASPALGEETVDASPVATDELAGTPTVTDDTTEVSASPVATEESTATATPNATEEPTETLTEESTTESTDEATETVAPTEEVLPTEEPAEMPLSVADAGDTENSGTAWNVVDGDPATAWLAAVTSSQVRLYLDLGSVQPIDRITLEMAWNGNLPYFEIWLSEDAETWYNATPSGINGWNLWAGEAIPINLGYDARFIRIVIPNVDESGLGQVGGIGEIVVWPGDVTQTSYLTSLGSPTTPTPEPVVEEPTAEPTDQAVEEPTAEPTNAVVEEPTEEIVEEPTVEEIVEPTSEPEDIPTEERTEDIPSDDVPEENEAVD